MKLDDLDLREMYNDYLDDVYGEIEICGYMYGASRAFELVDETAHQCGLSDWLDAEVTEGNIFEKDGEYYDEEPEEDEE